MTAKDQPRQVGQPVREAVALRYRQDEGRAPRVTAKGKGTIADQILALAEEHGIPLHQDNDLVTCLQALDLGSEIPPDLYQALAEILAHLYRMDRRLAEGS